MHHGTLGQVWRDEFGETLEVVLVAATNVENCWAVWVEMGGFFSDRIEADFGENPHAENVSLFGIIESLLSSILPCSAAIL
jgi:phosphatidylserine decarboxylase